MTGSCLCFFGRCCSNAASLSGMILHVSVAGAEPSQSSCTNGARTGRGGVNKSPESGTLGGGKDRTCLWACPRGKEVVWLPSLCFSLGELLRYFSLGFTDPQMV